MSVLRGLRSRVVGERRGAVGGVDLEQLGRLPPDVKVNMTVDMTEAMVSVCLEGVRAQNPKLTDVELMERLRERFEWAKRRRVGRG
ncbi:MAG TPA: hypothetical protein VMT42_03140 [candidate division Zixibacteria bacterium]|nr:hypothetical protein [candidate division Zixibacteria bacterium]